MSAGHELSDSLVLPQKRTRVLPLLSDDNILELSVSDTDVLGTTANVNSTPPLGLLPVLSESVKRIFLEHTTSLKVILIAAMV
jgi:hypothetical protein